MTTTGNEALFWQNVEDSNYDGATQYVPSAAEQLRASADKYLEDAVEAGDVTQSQIYLNKSLGKYAGYTTVETASGVRIMKTSDGFFAITAEFDETRPSEPVGTHLDLKVEIELPQDGPAIVREDRLRVVDFTPTNDRGNRTLSKNGRDRAMGQVAKMIWQVYE